MKTTKPIHSSGNDYVTPAMTGVVSTETAFLQTSPTNITGNGGEDFSFGDDIII